METEIIAQPISGKFEERIYDNSSAWNSQDWTWVKFTDDNLKVTVGQFRGSPKNVKFSENRNEIIVLTSDYAYRLSAKNLDLIEYREQTGYQDLELSPNGIFLFHNFYEIEKMGKGLNDMEEIKSPFQMDCIQFLNWKGNNLQFSCDEFTNWERQENMILDTNSWEIKID